MGLSVDNPAPAKHPSEDNPFTPEKTAGKFFAGRERQLKRIGELLDAHARGTPSNMHAVGRGGEGKTSFLEKIVAEAESQHHRRLRKTLLV